MLPGRYAHFVRCVMSLIRGVKSKHPCPICLIPSDKLSDRLAVYPLRSAKESQEHVRRTATMTAQDRNSELQKLGLRPVEVHL